jgi:hypothetical protein
MDFAFNLEVNLSVDLGGHSRNSVRLDKALQIQNHDNRHC